MEGKSGLNQNGKIMWQISDENDDRFLVELDGSWLDLKYQEMAHVSSDWNMVESKIGLEATPKIVCRLTGRLCGNFKHSFNFK